MGSTALATGAHVNPATRWKPIDGIRLRRWHSLLEAGASEDDAWLTVATDPVLGLGDWKGKDRVPAHTLASSLSRFLARAAPEALRHAKYGIVARISRQSTDVPETLRRIRQGEFESDNPGVQLAATKLTLQALGVVETGNRTHVDARTAVQVNHVEVSRDQLRAITGDADTLQRALALAASLEAAPSEPAGEAD